MGDNPKPKVGYQPPRDSAHATQLLADIEALRVYIGGKTVGRNKSSPRGLTDQILNSMEGYIRKGESNHLSESYNSASKHQNKLTRPSR